MSLGAWARVDLQLQPASTLDTAVTLAEAEREKTGKDRDCPTACLKKPVGLDPFLSQEEVALKLRLKSRCDAERAKGTPKVYFRGCHLYVNGREVLP